MASRSMPPPDHISDTASEITISAPDISRSTSIVSAAISQASHTRLLDGNPGPSTRPTAQKNGNHYEVAKQSRSSFQPRVVRATQRLSPEEYFNPVIRQHVFDNGHTTGTVLGAQKRREMCAFYRWSPRTDVGKALIENRDDDALQGVLTSKKLGTWMSRRSDNAVTDLHLAAGFGVLEVVDALLEITDMKSVNHGDLIRRYPFTPHMPIDYAVVGNHVEVVASFVRAGALLDSASVTPLCFAVKTSAYGVADLLLEYGCDPLAVCDYGSPLHRACKANNTLLVKAFSASRTDVNSIVPFQILHPMPLQHPSYFGLGHTALLRIDVDPLAWAVFNGSYEATEILVGQGASTEIEYSAEFVSGGKRVSHVTALSLAAAKDFHRIVQLLLERKPSAKTRDHAFATAIYNKADRPARLLADVGAKTTFVTKAWGKLLRVDGVASKPVAAEA